MPKRWLDKWRGEWTPGLRVGTAVTVNGTAGYTIAGYDYAGRRYRVLKVVADPPSRDDKWADPSVVVVS